MCPPERDRWPRERAGLRGVVARVRRLARSTVHALLAPADDPRRRFPDVGTRERELLGRVRQALATVAAARRQVQVRADGLGPRLSEMKQQARRALAPGQDSQARRILQHRRLVELELRALERQGARLADEEQRLGLIAERLASRLDTLRMHHEILAARRDAARAEVHLTEALTDISEDTDDPDGSLERMERERDELEARAVAIGQLLQAGRLPSAVLPVTDSLARELDALDADQAVEAQLDALKGHPASDR